MRIYEVTRKPRDTILRMRGCKVAPLNRTERRGKENIDSVLNTAEIATMVNDIKSDEMSWERRDAHMPARPKATRK